MKGRDIGKEKKRKQILTLLALNTVVSAYFAGLLHTALSGYGASFNPFTHLKCAALYGIPFRKFFTLFILFGATVGCALLYQHYNQKGMDVMGRSFRHKKNRIGYGYDSHFESPDEYADVAYVQDQKHAYGTILGQLDDSGTKLINFRMDQEHSLNKHIAVVGASRSGKTHGFVKPYIYQAVKRRESIIFTDPKGELYMDMAGYLQDNGYVVRRLDLKKINISDGWDCMKSIHMETAELDAQIFAQAVIENTSSDPDGIYGAGPMSLLKALLLRVKLGDDFPEHRKTISTVYQMIQHPEGETYLDAMFNDDELTGPVRACIGPYVTFKQSSPNLRGNIIVNLAAQLQVLQAEDVRKLLSTDDIDLELPGKQPCAYFCVFPDDHRTYKFITSLFFTMLFHTLVEYADYLPTRMLPVPVNLLLDEFPSIGKIPDMDQRISTVQSRAMNVVMIYQSDSQVERVYEKAWVTILTNCATKLCLGINDPITARLWSERIGRTTVTVQTDQHKASSVIGYITSWLRSHSEGEGQRDLLSIDEIQKMKLDECLILFQGHNPIWAKKYPHTLHSESKKLRKILPEEIPSMQDIEGRRLRRLREDAYIAQYMLDHPLECDRTYENCSDGAMRIESVSETVKKEVKNAAKRGIEALNSIARTKSGESDQGIVIEETEFIVPVPAVMSVAEDAGITEVQMAAEDADITLGASVTSDATSVVKFAPVEQKNLGSEENPSYADDAFVILPDNADIRVAERKTADAPQSEQETKEAPHAPETESQMGKTHNAQKTQRDRFGRGFRETGNGKRTFTERITEINQATLRK